jgi:ferric-dicitrate binding protein FerR (iron transport regulator)
MTDRTFETTEESDRLTKRVAETISRYADRVTVARMAKPLAFSSIAARIGMTRRRRRARTLGVAGVVVAGLFGIWAQRHHRDLRQDSLTFTVDGAAALQGGYVASARTAQPMLSFSDGTRIQMAPLARGRVLDLNAHGARVILEEGRANVEVVHRPGAQWQFEAGPFLITVHGTAFSFGWSTRDARFDIQMRSGVVSVTGPSSDGEILLRDTQTLSLTLNDSGALTATATAKDEGSPLDDDAPPSSSDFAQRAAPSMASAAPSSQVRDWASKLANGNAAEIVEDAERRGMNRVLETSSSEDIAALADAARFERRNALAKRALLTQRRRFPGSVRANEASFLLGRLDDASDGSGARSLRWYDLYLKEAPSGAFVSEALGRKMVVLERTGNHAAALRIALDYLLCFPEGTYAHAAKALVNAS